MKKYRKINVDVLGKRLSELTVRCSFAHRRAGMARDFYCRIAKPTLKQDYPHFKTAFEWDFPPSHSPTVTIKFLDSEITRVYNLESMDQRKLLLHLNADVQAKATKELRDELINNQKHIWWRMNDGL